MKIIIALLLSCFAASSAQLSINIGTANNDGTGDTLRSAFAKVNTNFTTLFSGITTWGNSVFVATNGNDSTGTRNNPAFPFATPYAAVQAATSGDTVFVFPGTYHTATNLWKNGVNMIFYQCSLTSTNRTNDGGFALFDDRFYSGGVTSRVQFAGSKLIWSAFSDRQTNANGSLSTLRPTNTIGAIVVTNPLSDITWIGGGIDYDMVQPSMSLGALAVVNCRTSYWEFPDGINDQRRHLGNVYIGVDEVSDPVYATAAGCAIYWERGEMFVKAGQLSGTAYTLWPNTDFASYPRQITNNLWVTADFMDGKIYSTSGATNYDWKIWVDVKEHRNGTNQYFPSPIWLSGGSSFYYRSFKTAEFSGQDQGSSGGPLMFVTTNSYGTYGGQPRAWVTSQKWSSPGAFIANYGGDIRSVNVDDYELIRGQYTAAMTLPGIANYPSVNGNIRIMGGSMTITNGFGILHAGGTTDVFGLRLTTLGFTNSPVVARTNGLVLTSVRIVNTNSIAVASDVNATNTVTMQSVWLNAVTGKVVTAVGPVLTNLFVR